MTHANAPLIPEGRRWLASLKVERCPELEPSAGGSVCGREVLRAGRAVWNQDCGITKCATTVKTRMIGTANTVRRDCPPSHRFDLGRSSSPTNTVASSANRMPALISDARTGNNGGGHTAGRLAAQAQLGRTGCASTTAARRLRRLILRDSVNQSRRGLAGGRSTSSIGRGLGGSNAWASIGFLSATSAQALSRHSGHCQDEVMSRLRSLSPWYWVMLSALLVALGVFVSDLFLDWAPKWLTFTATLAPLAAGIYTIRLLWKQTDHPAFHGDERSTKRPPSDNGNDSSATREPAPDSR